MKTLARLSILFLAIGNIENAYAGRDSTVCGAVKERLLFTIWSSLTPSPQPNAIIKNPNIELTEFKTGDGVTLRGYKYNAHDNNNDNKPHPPKGFLLFALGNAMIADQIINYLDAYTKVGYDVYIYDYRGYGLSDGNRRINAIIEDYKEIINYLNTLYSRTFLYGVSFGGIPIMSAIGSGVRYDKVVIDSTPSRLSDYGCPNYLDPVINLSLGTATNLLVVTGKKDRVLPPKMTSEFREKAKELGAITFDDDSFEHPFMDSNQQVHERRTLLIEKFFLENEQ